MADKMYWAGTCRRCTGMVAYREVRYTPDIGEREIEEILPEGTVKRRCDHCGSMGEFDLRQLRPTAIKFLIPKVQ
jgi:hypothetical protein